MNKKDKLLITAWKIENTFKEIGYNTIKTCVITLPHEHIAIYNQGILIMEISFELDWVIDSFYPITKSFFNKITMNLD